MLRVVFLSVALVSSVAGTASAQATLINGLGGVAGYGTSCLGPNDDGSSAVIDLAPFFPSGLRFFTMTHTRAYVNTNGNITFAGPVSTFTPAAFPVSSQPMIAPYWGDVDIRWSGGTCRNGNGIGTAATTAVCHNPTENGVWWYLEAGRMVVTWDRTDYYKSLCSGDHSRRMSFQLVLTAVDGCGGEGDFDVEFRYNRCEWESGDASGGSGGFGGTEAQAGFDAGNDVDFVAIMGSMAPGIAANLCTNSNVGETGIWRFQIRGGTIMCPDAGRECPTGLLGVCATGHTNCVGMGTECAQDVTPSDERCDALDNDCDGSIDEGDGLCRASEVCDRGTCVTRCDIEFGCIEGQSCTSDGLCVDAGCESLVCAEGERCEMGACVGACDGVRCPSGQVCRGGRCVDLCATTTCDDCTACEEGTGTCVPRCQFSGCPAGETCLDDGHCIEDGCIDRGCDPGTVCRAGACVDACADAVCPRGETCMGGMCVAIPRTDPDAGPLTRNDGGYVPGTDAGPGSTVDGGVAIDGGREINRRTDDCTCSGGGPLRIDLLASVLAIGFVLARRRRR
jgi:hypothetical protein